MPAGDSIGLCVDFVSADSGTPRPVNHFPQSSSQEMNMNRRMTWTAACLAVCLMSVVTVSADPGDPPPDRPRGDRPDRERGPRGPEGFGGRGFGHPPNPFMEALDKDHDGEISAEEIQDAVAALKSMDADEDGKLSHAEVHPKLGDQRPGGPPREGRRPGGPPPEGRRPDGPPPEGDRPDGPPPEGDRPEGPPPEGRPERDAAAFVDRMLSHDEDGDDLLSEEEVPERMQRLFTNADSDEDGFLSRDELTELAKKRHGGKKGNGTGAGGGGKGGGKKGGSPNPPPAE